MGLCGCAGCTIVLVSAEIHWNLYSASRNGVDRSNGPWIKNPLALITCQSHFSGERLYWFTCISSWKIKHCRYGYYEDIHRVSISIPLNFLRLRILLRIFEPFTFVFARILLLNWFGMLKHETTSCRYYSLHGHVEIMAREIHRGVNSVEGVEATLWRVTSWIWSNQQQILMLVRSFNILKRVWLTWLEWSRCPRRFPVSYCKRWRPLLRQMMCRK